MTRDEAEIRSIIGDHAKALYGKNADLLFAHGGGGFRAFGLAPPLEERDDAAAERAGAEAWFATWKGPIGWEDRDVVVTADRDVAFSTALSRITGTKTDGEEVSLWLRSTNGFRKEGGVWKLVHTHNSVPFYMDGSFRACVDLKP